ncbi:MAG: mechanosensitive ion channel family protein [Cyanobacteria bacterium P01_H01_bin.21]
MNLPRFNARQLQYRHRDRKWLSRLGSFLLSVALVILTAGSTPTPVLAQLGGLTGGSSSQTAVGWITLDGQQIFQIAAPSAALSIRQQNINENLRDIRDTYVSMAEPEADIVRSTPETADAPSLYVNGRYLMTLTDTDARTQGTTVSGLEQEIRQDVSQALQQAYQERQPAYLQRAGLMTMGAIVGAIALSLIMQFSRYQLSNWAEQNLPGERPEKVLENHQRKFHVIRHILLPLLQFVILAAAFIWSLGLFPTTRAFQSSLLVWTKVPVAIVIIAIVAYLGVRVSYVLIDRFVNTLQDRSGFDFENYRRLDLRISTISSVIKNIANFVWLLIGLLIALSIFGINLGVLLASFGIVGLALSLATQNLIKGAVTGFFILLEDQYAIGDVVKIGDDAGLVENMNLRITQLRDTEGRLITIPTSDITRVANYSLHWSRCDLMLPIHYEANVDEMLQLVREVGNDLRNDPDWGELILEAPDILGVENFGDSSITLRVWIKTQPLKQWDVSREYRRRFKQALEDMDTNIPFPQRQVWLNAPDGIQVNLSGELHRIAEKSNDKFSRNDHSNGSRNGHRAKTDRQPHGSIGDDGEADGEAAAEAD